MLTEEAGTRGRTACEVKRIWSHLLLLGSQEGLPSFAPALRQQAETLPLLIG
jgi:hypothetical protein